jgi:hypothetical protein
MVQEMEVTEYEKQLRHSLHVIRQDLVWLNKIIEFRIEQHFGGAEWHSFPPDLAPPDLSADDSFYAYLLHKNDFNVYERIILLMALAVHLSPTCFDIFFLKNENFNRGYTEFGGVTGTVHSGFIPTGETVSFILCGRDLEKRFQMLEYFSDYHAFHVQNILHLTDVKEGEPVFSGALTISKEYLSLLTQGKPYHPHYTSTFPARRLTTQLTHEDAVYDDHTWAALEDVSGWISHGKDIMTDESLRRYLKQGYRVLFYGPPGTGKTMTAAILGKEAGLDVYQVDLSAVVSKYIGETEKNLAALFNLAENKQWILFFDEADALFGKRMQTQSSNDQFANQQVSYLLQRIEDFNGTVILATNFKDNIDAAFLRRFQSIVYFPKPRAEQRLRLWKKYFSGSFEVQADLEAISKEFELTGGSIINVLRYCSIAARKRKSNVITSEDIYKGINKEYQKDGITAS